MSLGLKGDSSYAKGEGEAEGGGSWIIVSEGSA